MCRKVIFNVFTRSVFRNQQKSDRLNGPKEVYNKVELRSPILKIEAFKKGFTHLKIKIIRKLRLKIKLTQTKIQKSISSMQVVSDLFSFQTPLNFDNPFASSGEISTCAKDPSEVSKGHCTNYPSL